MTSFSYLAVDVETTGLDTSRSHIVQLAAIYDDGVSDLDKLPQFTCQIQWPVLTYAESYALKMNVDKLFNGISIEEARQNFQDFLDTIGGGDRIFLAGKNVGGFDLPLLRSNGFNTRRFLHRTYDPGTLFSSHFNSIPSLDQIATLIKAPPVDHTALGDCKLVVQAIRWHRNHE